MLQTSSESSLASSTTIPLATAKVKKQRQDTPTSVNSDEDGHTISTGGDEETISMHDSVYSMTHSLYHEENHGAEQEDDDPEETTTKAEVRMKEPPANDPLAAPAAAVTPNSSARGEALSLGHISGASMRIIRHKSILKTGNSTNNTARSSTKSSSSQREVAFDSIQIRHYSMQIGEHPSCSIGAPVMLSWEYEEEAAMDVDVYEFSRAPRRKIRYLVLNFYKRMDILRNAGYNEREINEADAERKKSQRQRCGTHFMLPCGRLEEAWQSAGRKLKRATQKKSK
jgi:hypothetical protein